jgi:predicted transposase YbfD/YdcC
VSGELAGWDGWPGLKSVCKVTRETWGRKGPDSYQTEEAYLISSLSADRFPPETFLAINRGHWGIENRVHYVRDVTMGEDASTVCMGSAPQVLAALRNAALTLVRSAGWSNVAAGFRHFGIKVNEALRFVGIIREN